MLTEEEGGKNTSLLSNSMIQLYFRTTDIGGYIILPSNVEKINPGDTVKLSVELLSSIAMEVGTEFSICDEKQIIARGTVTKIN